MCTDWGRHYTTSTFLLKFYYVYHNIYCNKIIYTLLDNCISLYFGFILHYFNCFFSGTLYVSVLILFLLQQLNFPSGALSSLILSYLRFSEPCLSFQNFLFLICCKVKPKRWLLSKLYVSLFISIYLSIYLYLEGMSPVDPQSILNPQRRYHKHGWQCTDSMMREAGHDTWQRSSSWINRKYVCHLKQWISISTFYSIYRKVWSVFFHLFVFFGSITV